MTKRNYRKKMDDDEGKFILPFDIDVLNIFCIFTISDNKSIRKSNLMHLRKLFDEIHPDSWNNDQQKLIRVNFINKALEAKLDYKMENKLLIIKHANGMLEDNQLLDLNALGELSNQEVDYVNSTVSTCLHNAYLFKCINQFGDLAAEAKVTDYKDMANVLNKFESNVKDATNYFRKTRNNNHEEGYLSLDPTIFEDKVYEFYNQLSSPSNKLLSGMQGLNEMLNGGFENGRHYVFFGLQGEGKSLLLLNLAIQIKLYNKDYKPKDPTKRPCVVYLTQENSERESFERMYNITVSRNDITKSKPEYIISDFADNDICLDEYNKIDLIIKFKAGGSCDTSYLFEFYDDLVDDGYEPIVFIHDYIHRIHCADKSSRNELRLEYGAVVNEEHNFAEEKDIPFITAGQLNRDATSRIDEGRAKNKSDLIRLLGRSNIAESMWVLSNTDGAFIIAPEKSADGIQYMGIQKIKGRFKASDRGHIYQPYDLYCPIKLITDEGEAEAKFRDTLRPDTLPNNGMELHVMDNEPITIPSSNEDRIEAKNVDDGIRLRFDRESTAAYTSPVPMGAIAIIPSNTISIIPEEVPLPFKINLNKNESTYEIKDKVVPLPFRIKL